MWYIEMGGSKNNIFNRKIFVEDVKIGEIRKRYNNTDVYTSVFYYNKDDQNESELYGSLYIDLDIDLKGDNQFNKVRNDLIKIVTYLESAYGIDKKYMKFYFSGNKGFHLLIPPSIFNISPCKQLNMYFKEIALELNKVTLNNSVDTKIYDKKRLFRLNNSINGKTGLYKVPITFENILKFDLEELKEYASSPKENIEVNPIPLEKAINKFREITESVNAPATKKRSNMDLPEIDIEKIKLPDCIVKILQEGAGEGNRNNTTVILSSALLQQRASYKDTLEIVMEWNDKKNCPSLNEREVAITVASAYQLVKSGRSYGCQSIKDCNLCIGKDCRIYK